MSPAVVTGEIAAGNWTTTATGVAGAAALELLSLLCGCPRDCSHWCVVAVVRHLHNASPRYLLEINQSNFYSANIPSEARLSGTTAESVFNSKNDEAVL